MYTIIGIIGAVLIILGFYRISVGKWNGKSFWYELDNLIGAIFVGIYQLHHKAYISVVINIVWGTVALRGLSSYAERSLKARK
jgi:uncharacterized membrane protein